MTCLTMKLTTHWGSPITVKRQSHRHTNYHPHCRRHERPAFTNLSIQPLNTDTGGHGLTLHQYQLTSSDETSHVLRIYRESTDFRTSCESTENTRPA